MHTALEQKIPQPEIFVGHNSICLTSRSIEGLAHFGINHYTVGDLYFAKWKLDASAVDAIDLFDSIASDFHQNEIGQIAYVFNPLKADSDLVATEIITSVTPMVDQSIYSGNCEIGIESNGLGLAFVVRHGRLIQACLAFTEDQAKTKVFDRWLKKIFCSIEVIDPNGEKIDISESLKPAINQLIEFRSKQ